MLKVYISLQETLTVLVILLITILKGLPEINVLSGGSGNDILVGGEGSDTITGDAGNDSLYGGAGNDAYEFSTGGGQDIISDESGDDILKINSHVTKDQLEFTQDGADLIIGIKGTLDTVTIKNWFNDEIQVQTSLLASTVFAPPPGSKIEMVQLTDGTTITYEEINQIITSQNGNIYGTEVNDFLTGNDHDNIIYGLWR
jgi:Ca2+-binding RTX toxin-like protein